MANNSRNEDLSICWYRDPAHRPTVGWSPATCNGPVTHSERAGNGDKRLYCEAHAYWRIKTIRLPLVRRLRPGEPLHSTRPEQSIPAEAPAARPMERAQLVWRRAIVLARPEHDADGFARSLDLLRTAHHGPSTMLHALGLGQAQLRAAPDDITRDAVHLLTHTIGWLGRPTEPNEIGVAHDLGSASLAST